MSNLSKSPLKIVLVPVRNEAWILRAFLTATSIWADYIIIADQMSADGSREIYAEFPKVRLIDNNNSEMHMAATRRLLFKEAQKIKGDKILFALDADEFLSGDFLNSAGWKSIVESKPGEVFSWRWMNLQPGCKTYTTWQPYYWAVHVSDDLWEGEFPDNFIHEWRLPWPKTVMKETVIKDFCSLHFARVNTIRQENKVRFYQMSTFAKQCSESGIRMYRMYHEQEKKERVFTLPSDAFITYLLHGVNILDLIKMDDEGKYYISECKRMVKEHGIKRFKKLDIWSDEFCFATNTSVPYKWVDKIIFFYLRKTGCLQTTFVVRAIDKLLRKFY